MKAIGGSHIIDMHHIRVIEGSRRASLSLEAGDKIRILGELGGKHFERDFPCQTFLPGQPYGTACASTEVALDRIAGNAGRVVPSCRTGAW